MILLFNTCGAEASVALSEDGRIVAEEKMGGREASEKLIPALRRLLAVAGPLQAVGVVHGPGSFTGVRVGLAAAKGLCEARGVGLIAMSRLALVAGQGNALAVLDAGRGEFYCGFYRDGAMEREEILKLDAVLAATEQRAVRTCEPKVHEVLSARLKICLIPEPGPRELQAMVQARMARSDWSDVATSDANYLRRTDAELLVEVK